MQERGPFLHGGGNLSSKETPDLSTLFRLQVPQSIYQQMVEQARSELPNECCGLLAGPKPGPLGGEANLGLALRCYPLVNALASPVEYESEPKCMFQAVKDMRQHGIDVLAVYHSHPTSAPVPSGKDMARNYSPDVINLIISLAGREPEVRAWWIDEGGYVGAEWELINDVE
jgi:proteasome lid subunit RPN8/RPN11